MRESPPLLLKWRKVAVQLGMVDNSNLGFLVVEEVVVDSYVANELVGGVCVFFVCFDDLCD